MTSGTKFAVISGRLRLGTAAVRGNAMQWMRGSMVMASLFLALSAHAAKPKPKPNKKPTPAPAPAAKSTPAAKGAPARPETAKAVEGAVKDADRPPPSAPDQAGGAPAPKGPTRIDFDDRLVEGQTNKSGAVYLYDRKDLQVDTMVKQRSSYREEIARGLLE